MTARISKGWMRTRRHGASFQPGATTRRWHACTCGIGPEHSPHAEPHRFQLTSSWAWSASRQVQDKWALCGAVVRWVPWAPAHGRSPRWPTMPTRGVWFCLSLTRRGPSARKSGSSSCLRTFTPECCCEDWWPERRRPTPCSGLSYTDSKQGLGTTAGGRWGAWGHSYALRSAAGWGHLPFLALCVAGPHYVLRPLGVRGDCAALHLAGDERSRVGQAAAGGAATVPHGLHESFRCCSECRDSPRRSSLPQRRISKSRHNGRRMWTPRCVGFSYKRRHAAITHLPRVTVFTLSWILWGVGGLGSPSGALRPSGLDALRSTADCAAFSTLHVTWHVMSGCAVVGNLWGEA